VDGFKKLPKYKTGGSVASAPSKAAVKPNFKGSDVAKEKSKPSGDAVSMIKSKQSGKSASAPSAAAKFNCGGSTNPYGGTDAKMGSGLTKIAETTKKKRGGKVC
jgi:hypothetical protein